MTVPQAYELAVQHHQAGRLAETEACCRQILAVQPNHFDALHLLGVVAYQTGRADRAVELISRAVALHPDDAVAYSNLGGAFCTLGRREEGIAALRRAIQLQPDYAEAYDNLGNALREQGEIDDAARAFRRSLEFNPDRGETHHHFANALKDQGHLEEAVAEYRCALRLKPDYAEAHSNLGATLAAQGRLDDAIVALRRAVELGPTDASCHNNLAVALARCGQLAEAAAAYRHALALQPDYDEAKCNYSVLLLLQGDFEQGWPLYEFRWNPVRFPQRNFSQPRWNGGNVDGRRILIHAEQGLGDSIHFIRYARLLAGRGGQVIVECQRPLVELFRGVQGVSEVVAAGDPLPPFDWHLPTLSLPLIFQTKRESIPAEIPYVFAEPVRREAWKERMGRDRSRLRIGLAWAGNPQHRWTRLRDLPLEALVPLLRVEGVDFFSLQLGRESEQFRQLSDAAAIIDHTAYIKDFADTAALMMGLDLILSVDTAVAHLAGALGRPVWTLLPFMPDWRWGLEGEDTPWYPTMRLFRQHALGDWASVIQRAAHELARMASAPSARPPAEGVP